MNKLSAVLLLRFVFAAGAAGAAPVRVLLPLYIAHPAGGAYGSLWSSELVMHNGSQLLTYGIETCRPSGCTADGRADEELLPNETEAGLPVRYPAPANPVAGAVLWLVPENTASDTAENVAFNLRVVDLSRSATAAGTEIPVVREHDFRTSMVHLLNVPVDARFRVALRLFEMNLDQANFTVEIFDQSNDMLLSRRQIRTSTGGVAPQGYTPGFAEITDIGAGAGSATRLRVQITAETPGAAFWAYASITNNDSQQITLVTPQ